MNKKRENLNNDHSGILPAIKNTGEVPMCPACGNPCIATHASVTRKSYAVIVRCVGCDKLYEVKP